MKNSSRGICLDKEKKYVLLIYENGSWRPPGGKLKIGEDANAATCREFAEETELIVKTSNRVDHVTDQEFCFVVRIIGGLLKQKQKRVGLSPNWFNIHELPKMYWRYKRMIKKAIRHQ
ncbi:MAG: NUDIX hydrolase [Candidatus Sungbacteria bacterium]|nr:NUDIX hydrolase [Candidatus Sungbacteria bacterium]